LLINRFYSIINNFDIHDSILARLVMAGQEKAREKAQYEQLRNLFSARVGRVGFSGDGDQVGLGEQAGRR
jgi:hypothetical protein